VAENNNGEDSRKKTTKKKRQDKKKPLPAGYTVPRTNQNLKQYRVAAAKRGKIRNQ